MLALLPAVALSLAVGPPAARRSVVQQPTVRMNAFTAALLFDCDGVLVETEELHRTAYNEAFSAFGLTVGGEPVVWTVEYYDKLQNTVGGGKPKMKYHFTQTVGVWPEVAQNPKQGATVKPASEAEGDALIDDLQDYKTDVYKTLVQSAQPRPGVIALMDAAIARPGLAVGICSASTRGGFEKVVDSIVGQERLAKLDVVIAGDDVSNKKPDPEIYNVAAQRLGMAKDECASAASGTRPRPRMPHAARCRRAHVGSDAAPPPLRGRCAHAATRRAQIRRRRGLPRRPCNRHVTAM